MAINHLEGHLLTTRLCSKVDFPYLLLLASGGHFLFAEIFAIGKYEVLGKTLDDAAGEAFDKVARMLGLGYPGGTAIEKHAVTGDCNRFQYTMPMQRRIGCDVSFSGIKTATKTHIESLKELSSEDKADVAASFQDVVVRFIVTQLKKAYKQTVSNPKTIVVCGGVAANIKLRQKMLKFCQHNDLTFSAPPLELCSDNAAMIGWAAVERIRAGCPYSALDAKTRSRWPITEI
jgi:N6-L-threonylcarbamoyladenine synthase